jgi:UDP-2-acetamido-2-deoxy-ribo-hexuluronate aminotransferase
MEEQSAYGDRGQRGDRWVCDHHAGLVDRIGGVYWGGKSGDKERGKGRTMVGNASAQAGLIADAVARVAAHGRWVGGPEVSDFERKVADYVGVRYAIGCNSGTDALILALKALGIGPCDKVAVPAFTFQATAAAVYAVGARPVFADIYENGYGINVSTIKARVKAIIGVDMFGIMAPWDEINAFAKWVDVPTIEDAAQAMGSDGAGKMGKIGCTSFYPSKPLAGIGDGGMVFTNHSAEAERIRSYANHGRAAEPFSAHVPGMNSRLDSVQAAVLLERLKTFDIEISFRKSKVLSYNGGSPVPHLYRCAWSWYPYLCESTAKRESLLKKYGPLGAKVIYPIPLNRMAAFADSAIACPVAEGVCERIIAFPIKHHWEENPCLDLVIQEGGLHEV